MSATNTIPVYLKAGTATVAAQPVSNDVAVTKTITATAVQQTRQPETTAAMARQVLPTLQEKRARLVGPPPAFEVNVLQHLKETRDRSDLQDAGQPEGAESSAMPARGSEETAPVEDAAVPSAYSVMTGISPEPADAPAATVDKFL
ncbi:MAG: hypothetical protein JJU07_11160 [Natronohydrobacter sp.]|nr:hypothetical protein [Natronohydrobacter sp.]